MRYSLLHGFLTLVGLFHPETHVSLVDCALLAESKLESCDRKAESDLECEEKAVLLLSIEQAQLLGTEALEIFVEDDEKRAETPIKITWSKTRSQWKYPLRYNQQV